MQVKDFLTKVVHLIQNERRYRKFDYERRQPLTSEELEGYLEQHAKYLKESFELQESIKYDLCMSPSPFLPEIDAFIESIQIDEPIPMIDSTSEVSSGQVKQAVRDILKGTEPYSIRMTRRLYEQMCKVSGDTGTVPDIFPTTQQMLLNRYEEIETSFLENGPDALNYHLAMFEVGLIFISKAVPPSIQDYFAEVRESYSLGLFRSSISLCRAMLEMTLINQFGAKKQQEIRNAKWGLCRIIKEAKKENLLGTDEEKKAMSIRDSGVFVLHKGETRPPPQKGKALEGGGGGGGVIRDTSSLVEYLYR